MKNHGAVESRRPSWSSVDGAASSSPTASTSAMPVQRGSAGGRRTSRYTARAPHSSAAPNAAARAMPTSHSSPAARTSGASGPCGSTLGGRNRHGSDPSSGSVIATSTNSTPVSTHASRWVTRRAASGCGFLSGCEQYAAATAITNHVSGSSRKPL